MKPELVYVNIGALVREDPGWKSLAQYRRMRTLVQQASVGAAQPLRGRVGNISLARISNLHLPGSAFSLPRNTLRQQSALLNQLQQKQLARLRARLLQSNSQSITDQLHVWRLTALQTYQSSVASILAQYNRNYGNAVAADGVARLNLTLQIRELEQTIAQWKLSTPPSPKLARYKTLLAHKQSRLAALLTTQAGSVTALKLGRNNALRQALNQKNNYIAQQRMQMTAQLQMQDAKTYAAQQALLSRQAAQALGQEQILVNAAIPTAGALGPLKLAGAISTAAPATGVYQAETLLKSQQARWMQDLVDENQAAAIDIGRQLGWRVTFQPHLNGVPDRTAQVAALMARKRDSL